MKNKEQRRQAQLEILKKLYSTQNEKKDFVVSTNKDDKNKNIVGENVLAMKNDYMRRDLINLLILTFVLILISVGLYIYNQQTNFLEPLANNLLKDIIK